MTTLTRKQRKEDFHNITHNLEIYPEDSAYQLLIALTKNSKLSTANVLNMDQRKLKNLKLTDSKGDTLEFYAWYISKIMYVKFYSLYQQEKQGINFRLSYFEHWNLSPACRRMICQDSFLNCDAGDTKIAMPLCYTSSSTTQGGHIDTSSSKKKVVISSEDDNPSFIDTPATINKEKMVAPLSVTKIDSSFIDNSPIEGSQANALNASKSQCSVTNEDCIDSSCRSISSENELSLEYSSMIHSSSTSHPLSSCRIP